ncbi:MAG: B12-binding domain-containing radical SAM protein [Muribaculaceae bacterium]|nr:B12-binding domain-containing radical SAM protein [Muribaculaceae bacterium]
MKVCFLIPPEPLAATPAERSAGCTRVVYPMPNLYELTVAALVESKGYAVDYVDLTASGGDLREFVGSSDADVFMIWTVNLSRAADFAARDAILELRPDAKVIFLGPGATFFPNLYLTDERVVIARGEPEMTVVELLDSWNTGGDWRGLDGLILLADGKMQRNRARKLMTDLDALPFAARHLLKGREFHNPKLKKGPYTTMLTSRNCPFHCIYCVPSSLTFARELDFRADNGRKPPISFRSPESIERELDQLAAEGYRAIGFVDDNFIWNEERTAALCKALRKHGFVWGCQARADAITEPIAKMLGESGCTYVDLGVESFNDEILKFIHKGVDSKRIFEAIALLKKYNVPVKLNILIGTSPLETKETLRETLHTAQSLKVDQVMFNIVSPFPGTEFYAMAKENGWIRGGEYEPTNVQRESILSYPHLTAEEMEKALFDFNLRYFLSPRIVWKHMRRFRSFGEFVAAFKALREKLFGR